MFWNRGRTQAINRSVMIPVLALSRPLVAWVFFLFVILLAFSIVPVHAQTEAQSVQETVSPAERTDVNKGSPPAFFIEPLAEVNGYSRKGISLGGGLVVGMGDGVGIGFRTLFAKSFGEEVLTSVELAVLLRFYPFFSNVPSGFFFQLEGGAVIYAGDKTLSLPAEGGQFSGGLSIGWRFLLGNRFFIEPALRLGYPYILGSGVCAGIQF